MKKQNKYITIFVLCCLLSIYTLGMLAQSNVNVENKPAYKYNFSSIYNPVETVFHPMVKAYCETDTSAIVFFKLSLDELKMSARNKLDSVYSLTIKYALRDVETFQIIDSAITIFKIDLGMNEDFFESYFRINPKSGNHYKMIIGFVGEKNNAGSRLILDYDNTENYSENIFLLERFSHKKEICYSNFVDSIKTYSVHSKKYDDAEINIEFYKSSNDIIVPPYYNLKNTDEIILPDSIFTYRMGDSIKFINRGYYIIKPPSQDVGAMCLLNFGDSYPNILKLSDMLDPIQLISTNKDYRATMASDNLKIAIDTYWLSLSNSQKFAREQIRVFYNRVALANRYFSDYRQGWKTDRGMLYVVLGPPTIVNISANAEEWFYGENPDVAGVLFRFEKRPSNFSGYEYFLIRDELYQTVWAQAINTWRKGRVFTITKN